MKPMNDQRFFDLAMKAIAHQASDAERAELDGLLAGNPALRSELGRLQAEAALAKEALSLVEASTVPAGKLPAYARDRLQTKVRESLGRPVEAGGKPDRSLAWGWRWWLGLAAAATAVIVGLVVFFAPASQVVVQVAVLDLAGTTRGASDADEALLRQTWQGAELRTFAAGDPLGPWLKTWPRNRGGTVVKVLYDRAAGEVQVTGQQAGRMFAKTFTVGAGLAASLKQVEEYLTAETRAKSDPDRRTNR